MRIIRRISATFKDVPGGQILGPTRDYTVRLLNFDLANESDGEAKDFIAQLITEASAEIFTQAPVFPKIIDILHQQGLLKLSETAKSQEKPDCDITRDGLTFPASPGSEVTNFSSG